MKNCRALILRTALGLVVLTDFLYNLAAADWPHWRGPHFNGATSETNLPAWWSKTENIAWQADLPGSSAATPIISGDHVFISTADLGEQSIAAMAVDRRNGKVLWKHKIGSGLGRDEHSDWTSNSPVANGKQVFFFYGNGQLVAFDFAGKKLWERNLQKDYGEFAYLWTFSTSPTLIGDKLYLQVLQRDVPVNGRGARNKLPIESYLLAVRPETGETLWRHVRPSQARGEARESFATPIPTVRNGRIELMILGGDDVTGHDPQTGRELWRWGTWNPQRIGHYRVVPSPVEGAGVVLTCAPTRDPVFAVKVEADGQGRGAKLLWTTAAQRDISSDVPTPLFYQGDFFILNEAKRTLARVEPASGKVKWLTELPGRARYEASPTGADGKIYLVNFTGEVVVVNPKSGKVISVIPMGEPGDDAIRSTIAAAHGQLFIRTNRKLFCVGRK